MPLRSFCSILVIFICVAHAQNVLLCTAPMIEHDTDTGGVRCCYPYDGVCAPEHEILICSSDGGHDRCIRCEEGFTQPDNTTSAFIANCYPKDECPKYETVPVDRPSVAPGCNIMCACNTSAGYFGPDPCRCNKASKPCGPGSQLEDDGYCKGCPEGTERKTFGFEKCKPKESETKINTTVNRVTDQRSPATDTQSGTSTPLVNVTSGEVEYKTPQSKFENKSKDVSEEVKSSKKEQTHSSVPSWGVMLTVLCSCVLVLVFCLILVQRVARQGSCVGVCPNSSFNFLNCNRIYNQASSDPDVVTYIPKRSDQFNRRDVLEPQRDETASTEVRIEDDIEVSCPNCAVPFRNPPSPFSCGSDVWHMSEDPQFPTLYSESTTSEQTTSVGVQSPDETERKVPFAQSGTASLEMKSEEVSEEVGVWFPQTANFKSERDAGSLAVDLTWPSLEPLSSNSDRDINLHPEQNNDETTKLMR